MASPKAHWLSYSTSADWISELHFKRARKSLRTPLGRSGGTRNSKGSFAQGPVDIEEARMKIGQAGRFFKSV